jgi:hypothetical protein
MFVTFTHSKTKKHPYDQTSKYQSEQIYRKE